MHPVVAMYATFLNRAFDQVLMDCALHGAGVTFVLDRAGITGDDGASHNGMWDLSLLPMIPGIRVAAPRDGARLRDLLDEAVSIGDGPTVVRFPKGALGAEVGAIDHEGSLEVLHRDGEEDVLLVSVGAFAPLALDVAKRLGDQGIGVTVVDPRWVIPVSDDLISMARRFRLVATVEDNGRVGGIGSTISQVLRDHSVFTPVRDFGIPPTFLDQGKRADVLARIGLTAQDVAREIVGTVATLGAVTVELATPPESNASTTP
jgi:1-deoxy-D-xylulose-5-phosphate synthase